MNDDLISRKALAMYFDTKAEAAKKLYDNGAAANTWHSAYEAVIDADAIDAEPVRHGRWIDMQEDDYTEGMWRCSACGSDRYFNIEILTPIEAGCYYCPNCGAKMRGDDGASE